MPRISKKRLNIIKRNQETTSTRESSGRPKVSNPFKKDRYPKTDLQIVLDIDRTLLIILKYSVSEELLPEDIRVRPGALEFVSFCRRIAAKVWYYTGADGEISQEKLRVAGLPELPLLSYDDLHKMKVDIKDDNWVRAYRSGIEVAEIKVVPLFDPTNTIIVDDMPDYYIHSQRTHVIPVAPFGKFTVDDNVLYQVGEFLYKIAKQKKRDIPAAIKKFVAENSYYFSRADVPKTQFEVVESRHGKNRRQLKMLNS